MAAPHDVIVKVGLTADQFIFMRDEAEALGLSHSAYLRLLVNQQRRSCALSQLSDSDGVSDMTKTGLDRSVGKTLHD